MMKNEWFCFFLGMVLTVIIAAGFMAIDRSGKHSVDWPCTQKAYGECIQYTKNAGKL